MNINIHSRTIEITDELRDRVEKRVRFALDAFAAHLDGAWVSIEDTNGPRGGVDKRCQLTAAVPGAGSVVVRVSAPTPASAVSRASRLLKYRISETLRQVQRPHGDSIRRVASAA